MSTTELTSREIITRIIEHKPAPRIGFAFNYPHFSDFAFTEILFENRFSQYNDWGTYPELMAKVPGFTGTVRMDAIGNIMGRLEDKTNGECVHGVITDDWDALSAFQFPPLAADTAKRLQDFSASAPDKFLVACPPVSVFATLRDARLMENALVDCMLEPECVSAFLQKVQTVLLECAKLGHEAGIQALMLYDDWGMQHSTFVSPAVFAELFKPVYAAVAQTLHQYGMKFIVHSCGLVWDFIPHFIEAGVDVLQFDQPELSGPENLAKAFDHKATLFSPVDIQKIMATGDRAQIENSARNMISVFRQYNDGALIAKDYPSWHDIDIAEEWATWARNIFLEEGWQK